MTDMHANKLGLLIPTLWHTRTHADEQAGAVDDISRPVISSAFKWAQNAKEVGKFAHARDVHMYTYTCTFRSTYL